MHIEYVNNDIFITNQSDFELKHIFDCGQCFRFNFTDENEVTGTAFGKSVSIAKDNDTVIIKDTSKEDFLNIWYDFLDLGRDYSKIKEKLTSDGDLVMKSAVSYGEGIRILNQDLWETIISFIISASNNIPRIKKIIELLCQNFGERHVYRGETRYSFPTPEKIASLTLSELSVIRAGFRDKYILECAKSVADGRLNLDDLKNIETNEAKKRLMDIYGVGNKVSDCILLFGLRRFDSFPVDVWIKRIMEYCYFENEQQSVNTISQFADKKFGDLGGIAQQYLFFYARECRIGVK